MNDSQTIEFVQNFKQIRSNLKREKNILCYVCGAKANGYNFDQITCESCKAFFRRNALKSTEKFRCRNDNNCLITLATRKRCKSCRLNKCFTVGMRKDWILTDEEKHLKREKIVRNRLIKQQAQMVLHQQTNDLIDSNFLTNKSNETSSIIYVSHPPDQHLYERQKVLLKQLSDRYHLITKEYPQPNQFHSRNRIISQTFDIDAKLLLVKDLTRDLTQMTTLRLLNFFNLIPEFQLLTEQEKRSILIQNMLIVFMLHGALTYNVDNDTFVDQTTNDQPYDAKYLSIVYGPRVYHNLINLARQLISVIHQLPNDKQSDERGHILFLLLMIILLFSNSFQMNSVENSQTKLNKIQQNYIDLTCRFIHDQFGLNIGREMLKRLLPLLNDLQKLCSTLANINLCELAEDDDRSTTIINHNQPSNTISSSTEFNSTMINEQSHLNELQKENREPTLSSTLIHNHQV